MGCSSSRTGPYTREISWIRKSAARGF
jgi:hypothetical protein